MRTFSIAARLWALIGVFALIVTLVMVVAGVKYADAERRVIEAGRFDVANNLAFLLDGEISTVQKVLRALAASSSLRKGEMDDFRREVEDSLPPSLAGVSIVEPDGRRTFSTLQSGQSLPDSRRIAAYAEVFEGKSVVTDVIEGTIAKRPIVSILVPVYRDGKVERALAGAIFPERLQDLFQKAGVNPDWAAAVVDRDARFVLRNIGDADVIGQVRPDARWMTQGGADRGNYQNRTLEGVASGITFVRSHVTGWTSVVSVPDDVLYAPLRETLLWTSLASALLWLACVALVTSMARQIGRNVELVGEAALALVDGRPLPKIESHITELEHVRQGFLQAQVVAAREREHTTHIETLLRELSHRTKNLLAVIQSMARMSAKSTRSVDEYVANFEGRLEGMAVSHEFLFAEELEEARLSGLIRAQLAPFAQGDRIRVSDCSRLRVKRSAVESLGMALHELAANSVRHGALSSPQGGVTLNCRVDGDASNAALLLEWTETGGPPIAEQRRPGFGFRVIDRVVAKAVRGRVTMSFEPEGFKWSLAIPREFYRVD